MDFDKADDDIILLLHAAFDLSNLLPKSRQWLVWVKTLFKTQMNKICLSHYYIGPKTTRPL